MPFSKPETSSFEKDSNFFSEVADANDKHGKKPYQETRYQGQYLLWIGSGPFGTLLLLSWKGSPALTSSDALRSPSALVIILLPAIAGRPGFLPPSTTNDINTRAPKKMANAAARTDPAGLLMVLRPAAPACLVLAWLLPRSSASAVSSSANTLLLLRFFSWGWRKWGMQHSTATARCGCIL
jgi:hypothetical protein